MSPIDNIRVSMKRVALACATSVPLAAVHVGTPAQSVPPVPAAGYTVLHQFQKTDGSAPYGELVQSRDGTFYGTAYESGDADAGTVFKMAPDGTFAVLHTFVATDGIAPATGLTLGRDGNLYGLTGGGGTDGAGTAFKLSPGGQFTLLHSFGGAANDGAYPYLGALVQAADGNFYGTTMQGGAGGAGVAFRMTPAGQVTVLHAFAGGASDGANPRGQLTLGADGKLYGTTLCGGVKNAAKGCGGTLFRLSTKGVFTILHDFSPTDAPQTALTEVGGFLYGTTSAGGSAGAGTVFKMSLDGLSFVTLHTFAPGTIASRKADGMAPTGRLLLASDGNLYGSTSKGGLNIVNDPNGSGTLFRITPAGAYTLFQSFGASDKDGTRPYAGLTQGQDGSLYGTTHDGAYQCDGTVFKLALPAL